MSSRLLPYGLALFGTATLLFSPTVPAQGRGRKYKAPPETSHISVAVTRDNNGKPIANAAVVFHPSKGGKDEGNLEVKTNEDGVASIDVIPTGSEVQVQVIADGFATFAQEYFIPEKTREIQIKMLPPRAQVSAYQDNAGKVSDEQPGVQEPDYLKHPRTPPPPPPPPLSDPSVAAPAQPGTPK